MEFKVYVSQCCGEEVDNIQWVGDEGCARCPSCYELCCVEEIEEEQGKVNYENMSTEYLQDMINRFGFSREDMPNLFKELDKRFFNLLNKQK